MKNKLDQNLNWCAECGTQTFIEKGLDTCWACIKKDPKYLKKYKKWKKEGKFLTFMGTPLDYDTLRAWILNPFTLEKHEKEAYKQFIKDHGKEHSDFGWFFEYHWTMGALSQNEINGLLKVVDEMEETGNLEKFKWTTKEQLFMENHLRYMVRQLMDDEDRYEFFEVFINQRTGKTTLNDDE